MHAARDDRVVSARRPIAWVDGWTTVRGRNRLRLWCIEGGRLEAHKEGGGVLQVARAYEPSVMSQSLAGGNESFEIENLSRLERLIKPANLTTQLIPGMRCNDHAVTVVRTRRGAIYVPMLLWIQVLWLRSLAWTEQILRPQSLDMAVPPAERVNGKLVCRVSPEFLGMQPSEDRLRRVAWLATSEDARKSWNSVLSSAYDGRLDMKLPPVRVSGWAWGRRVGGGLAACELMSVGVEFSLPDDVPIEVGAKRHPCPPSASKRDTSFDFDWLS